MKKSFILSSLVFLMAWLATPSPAIPVYAERNFLITQNSQNSLKNISTGATQLELMNVGAEPRIKLRLNPSSRINVKQTLIMTLKMDMTMSAGGKTAPRVNTPTSVVTMDVVVTQVDANGDIHTNFYYADAQVIAAPNSPPYMIEQMQAAMQKIVGLNGSLIMDSLGNIKEVNFVLPANFDDPLLQNFDQLWNSIKQASSPFPEEAVGIGAKWQVTTAPNINGIILEQIATYELVSVENNIITLDVSMRQQAEPQNWNPPGLPANATMNLKSYNSQGQGRVMIELDQIMPIWANLSVESNIENQVNVTIADQVQATILNITVFMEMNMQSN